MGRPSPGPADHELPPNSARPFVRMSWNRSNDVGAVVLLAAGAAAGCAATGELLVCGGFDGTLHSATTMGSTAVRRSWSLNSELKVGGVCAAAMGGTVAAVAEAGGGADPAANALVVAAMSVTARAVRATGAVAGRADWAAVASITAG